MRIKIMNKMNTIFTTLLLTLISNIALAARPAAPAVPVNSDMVAFHQVSQSLSLIGKLQSKQFVSIASEVSAKVTHINVQANQRVEKGQLLIQLDGTKANALLAEAEAYLNDEKRKLKEYQLLVKKQAITQTEYNAQLAAVDIGNARLLAAQVLVDNHRIVAPFSGTIGLIDFSEGKLVSVGETLLTLDNLSQMTLDLPVPERYLPMLNIGMEVSATSRAWDNFVFTGQVMAVDSRVNTDTLNLRVRLLFDNKSGQLKPGMMMSSTLVFDPINAPIIPVQALEYAGTKRFVYVLNESGINSKGDTANKGNKGNGSKGNGAKGGNAEKNMTAKENGQNNKEYKVERREVILGARIQDQVLIESGLSIGERIVVQGLVNMRDGILVNDLGQVPNATAGDVK
jgi:RND family efflux transporter MFP subunit